MLEESEDSPYFDVAQTGFRPGLCTQDSLYLLRNFVGKKRHRTNIVPGILVAVDLEKAFDTVEHSAIIHSREECGATPRMINFIKSFLHNRTFEISTGAQQPKIFSKFSRCSTGCYLISFPF